MKHTLKYILLLVAAWVTACTSDTTRDLAQTPHTVINISAGADARTALGDKVADVYPVYWSTDDQVAINGVASSKIAIDTNPRSASFTFDALLQTPYHALYPASAYRTDTRVEVSPTQLYKAGSFGEGSALMAATSADSNLTMHHLCGFVKLQIVQSSATGADTEPLRYISIQGNNGEQLSGAFTLDYTAQTLALTATSTATADGTLRLQMPQYVALQTAAPIEFVIAVPATDFTGGFTINVVDESGHCMHKSTSSEQHIRAGVLTVMPQFTFTPTDTVAVGGIESAADLVALAEDVNNGRSIDFWKNTEGNICLTGDIDMTGVTAWPAIGNADHPFVGTLDGGNHAITNLTASKPLLGYVAKGSVVKNLTLDSSCAFTYTAAAEGVVRAAALAEVSSADISNCTSAATVTCNVTSADAQVCTAGIVACAAGGTLNGVTNSGAVTLQSSAAVATPKVAGIAACTTSAVTFTECTNTGAVSASASVDMPNLHIGGITGHERAASAYAKCHNAGTVATHFTAAYKATSPCAGGVIGYAAGAATLSDCKNTASVEIAESNGGTALKSVTRASWGGIIGEIAQIGVHLTHCYNYGEVVDASENFYNNQASTDYSNAFGGIVGYAEGTQSGAVQIVGCEHSGARIYAKRAYLGGIVGVGVYTAASDCYTSGTLQSPTTIQTLGGIAGYFSQGSITSCKNLATVNGNASTAKAAGIVGTLGENGTLTDNISSTDVLTASNSGKAYAIAVTSTTSSTINHCGVAGTVNGTTLTQANFASMLCDDSNFTCTTANYLYAGDNVSGKVVDTSGNPLSGVLVSDGYQVVQTGSDGRYSMQSDLQRRHFIQVTAPEGYAVAVANGMPQFYKTISTSDATVTADFTLTPLNTPDRYTVFITADPQIRDPSATYDSFAYHSFNIYDDLILDLRTEAASITDRPCYGICLGDMVHNDVMKTTSTAALYPRYLQGIKELPFPTFHVIGNHDHTQCTAAECDTNGTYVSDDASTHYRYYMGPLNYSMTIGKIHYIFLDTILMQDNSSMTSGTGSYLTGLTLDACTWLQNDLKYVPTSTPIIISCHSQLYKVGGGDNSIDAVNAATYTSLFSNYTTVNCWAGHHHIQYNYIYAKPDKSYTTATTSKYPNVEAHLVARATGSLWLNEVICDDGTPRGYMVLNVNGTSTSWYFKPLSYASGVKTSYTKDNYQMKVYTPGTYSDKYLYVNVWNWDARWTVKYSDSGKTNVAMTQYKTYDYDAKVTYEKYKALYPSTYGSSASYSTDVFHMFRILPTTGATSATITATDRYGNSCTKSVTW